MIPVLGIFGWEHRDSLASTADSLIARTGGDERVPRLGSPLPSLGGEAKVVHLRSRPGLDQPAARVTRWSISDRRFGRVSVYVPVGTTPREALTIALAERGYQVVVG